jgi:MoxR-like ATPase
VNVAEVQALAARIRAQTAKAVVGQDDTIDLMLTALFAGGHVLLEGPPARPRPSWPSASPAR